MRWSYPRNIQRGNAPHITLAASVLLITGTQTLGCFAPAPAPAGNPNGSSGGTTDFETSSDTSDPPTNTGDGSISSTLPDTIGSDTASSDTCGNGHIDGNEVCDDGVNDGSYGGCASDCSTLGPYCGDAVVDPKEACDDANSDPADGCLADCTIPASCGNILDTEPMAQTGLFVIDADGPGGVGSFDVYCDMDRAGGGWTLVLVSADDGADTWTWNNRDLMTTDQSLVGNVAVRDHDFKSAAYHSLQFSDLLFVHQPSELWASYDNVGTGSSDIGSFLWSLPYPQCDLKSGTAMTEGSLSINGTLLCNTDLYFHPGDFDGGAGAADYCLNYTHPSSGGTYGPAWSISNNQGCPMDDPQQASLGPYPETCGQICEDDDRGNLEQDGRGFGFAMGVDDAGDRIEMYLR